VRWIWLLALLACGDNVTPRLEPVRYAIAGVEVADPRVFHDRARGEDCAAVSWADGATYCTPTYSDAVYTDPICTQPMARTVDLPSGGYAATYFILRGQATLRRLHPVLGEVPPPAQFWVLRDATCVGPYTGDATARFGAVGPELDESAFVRLRRSAPEGSGRLQLIAWYTDDGLHAPAGFHDRTLGADCTLADHADADAVACEPDAQQADGFSDPACTRPVVQTVTSPPAFAWYYTGACPTYAAVGDEVIDQTLYGLSGSACTRAQLPDGWREFALGDPIELATMTRERGAGARIQPITLVAKGLRTPDDLVHDTALATDCHPGPLAGTTRCVPATTTAIVSYFIDDTCLDPIDVALVPTGTCTSPPRFAFRPDAFHAIGEPVPMQLYEVSTGDRCVPYTPAPPYVARMVGPPLPLETFVAADVRY